MGRKWGAVAAVAAILGGGVCLAIALQPSPKGLPGPVSHAGNPPLAKPLAPAASTTTTAPPLTSPQSLPISLQVPDVDINVNLTTPLGITGFGTIQVPSGTAQPAWYKNGPSPGQIGSSLILGHVDSYLGPGIFFNLRELVPGDTLNVHLADGYVDTFQVTYVGEYQKVAFPSALVYGNHGYAGLNLITCGGVFDSATGHYLSNIVVFTKLVNVNAS
jgi:hypothetical protein